MRTTIRRTTAVVIIVHGLVHLMGAMKGLGWADVARLNQPISTPMGVAWLLTAVLVTAAGAMILVDARGWWMVSALGAATSQALIITSWSDARAGTVANVVLVVATVYGVRSRGPGSHRARFRQLTTRTATTARSHRAFTTATVTEDDLAHLPPPVAAYVRATGAVGRPHVTGFHANISGRIRSGPDKPWMPWTGEQVNTFGDEPSRVLYMDATMKGLPTDVLHAYIGPHATMQVRLASLLPVVDAHGPWMDQAETVTILNDMCVLAPAALVDAPITWTAIDDNHAQATLTNAAHTVTGILTFNDANELVDFVSDDRLCASSDGQSFTQQRWSTPVTNYHTFNGRRLAALGSARWHPDNEPGFDYLEFHTNDITYFETPPASAARPTVSATSDNDR